jgi:hypothetical protein
MATLIYFKSDNTTTIYNNVLNLNFNNFYDLYHYFLTHTCMLEFYHYDEIMRDYPYMMHSYPDKSTYLFNNDVMFITKIENNCIYYNVSGHYLNFYHYFAMMENVIKHQYNSYFKIILKDKSFCLCQNKHGTICYDCINKYKSYKFYQILYINHFDIIDDIKYIIKCYFVYF